MKWLENNFGHKEDTKDWYNNFQGYQFGHVTKCPPGSTKNSHVLNHSFSTKGPKYNIFRDYFINVRYVLYQAHYMFLVMT